MAGPAGFSFRLAVVPPARLALRVWPAVNECVIHHRHLPEYGRADSQCGPRRRRRPAAGRRLVVVRRAVRALRAERQAGDGDRDGRGEDDQAGQLAADEAGVQRQRAARGGGADLGVVRRGVAGRGCAGWGWRDGREQAGRVGRAGDGGRVGRQRGQRGRRRQAATVAGRRVGRRGCVGAATTATSPSALNGLASLALAVAVSVRFLPVPAIFQTAIRAWSSSA